MVIFANTIFSFGVLFVSLPMIHSYYVSPACHNDENCKLPDCFCTYGDIPGDVTESETPQMVVFTFTGALTRSVREAIKDVFPDTLRNPNRCPVGITIFVVSEGSDDCGIYRMYYRGHEIALAGVNRTGWAKTNWKEQIVTQHAMMTDRSNIDPTEITGMRAQKLKPGGDAQFDVLVADGLLYDSSILAGPTTTLDRKNPYYWPFTLDKTLDDIDIQCRNPECPSKPYKGIWEIPVSSLISTRGGKPRLCTYLDDCVTDIKTGSAVANLLETHFMHSYLGNRAPFQVNIQPKSLTTKIIVEGLKEFIKSVMKKDGTWIVTNQEALAWAQQPTPLPTLVESGLWDCPGKGDYIKCELKDEKNKTSMRVTLKEIIYVDTFWIWQTAILVVLYFVTYRYDRYVHSS